MTAMNPVTHVTENKDSGTYHLIDPDRPTEKPAITLCGRNGMFNRPVKHGHVAVEVAENVCTTCRRAAESDALLPIYERADEYENGC
jgi:hypothetical protein